MTKELNVGYKPYTHIVKEAIEAGYNQVFANNKYPKKTLCPVCSNEMKSYVPREAQNRPWIKHNTALVFRWGTTRKYATVYACRCGWRKFIGGNTTKVKKVTPATPVERAFVKCKCGNVLPPGRKRHCYVCVAPPATKQKEVVM